MYIPLSVSQSSSPPTGPSCCWTRSSSSTSSSLTIVNVWKWMWLVWLVIDDWIGLDDGRSRGL
jgi:hypothetical protein